VNTNLLTYKIECTEHLSFVSNFEGAKCDSMYEGVKSDPTRLERFETLNIERGRVVSAFLVQQWGG
jgi:hypothetical protein